MRHVPCILLLEWSTTSQRLWVYRISVPYAQKDPIFLFEKRRGQPREFWSLVSTIDGSTLPQDCVEKKKKKKKATSRFLLPMTCNFWEPFSIVICHRILLSKLSLANCAVKCNYIYITSQDKEIIISNTMELEKHIPAQKNISRKPSMISNTIRVFDLHYCQISCIM